MEFTNLTYKVNMGFRKAPKEILHGLNGRFTSGHLIAILGASGSGKTSLLNVLSGYVSGGITGDITYKNERTNTKRFKSTSCYITQENQLQPLLTVEEYMILAAELRCEDFEKENRIANILHTLGLYDVRKTRVSEISGGERRRVSIGVELLMNRSIMFLDEPTTGLDSSSCHRCVEYLKDLTRKGKTVICTIHQPSASTFYMFDEIYILNSGSCFYHGRSEDLLPFLEDIGASCPIFHNPADYVIELINGDYGSGIQNQVISKSLERQKLCFSEVDEEVAEQLPEFPRKKSSNYRQLKILLWREYVKASRNLILTYLRLVTSVVNSLTLSLIFWKVGSDGSKVWFNYNAILGYILHLMMPSLMLTVLTFPKEVKVLRNEVFNQWYSIKTYYASITLIDLPICIIYCLVSNTIIYYLTEQPQEIDRYMMFSTLGFLICINAQSIGLLVGALCDIVVGTFVGSAVCVPLMIFGGFFVTFRDIPPYLSWISHLSYLRYGVEGMVGSVNGYNRTKLPCPNDDFCMFKYTSKFLEECGIQGERFWIDLLALVISLVCLRIATYFALKRKVYAR